MTSRISKIAAICLVATVVSCVLLALLDSTFDVLADGSWSSSKTNTIDKEARLSPQSSTATTPIINPLSFMYQPRLPPRKGYMIRRQERTSDELLFLAVPPVQVLVCVEALCIDSQRFFHDQLMTAFNALGEDVMNLTVVSFGNAKIAPSNDNITCQHGLGECDTNTFEQCAVHLYPEPAQHVPYLGCLFASLPMGHRDHPFEQWIGLEPCAHTHHLDFGLLQQCHDDAALSWRLQQEAAKATPTRHDHVPWVEINGMHMDEDSTTLWREVCKVYSQAGGHTAGCSSYFE